MSSTQLPDSQIWFVRAERGNALASYFLENGIVEMGWQIGLLGPVDSIDEIASLLRARYPYKRLETLSKWAREIREFNQKMEVEDAVATYEQHGRTYHIGIIRDLLVPAELGPHYNKWGNDYVHRVEWRYRVGRDTLPQGFARKHLDRRSTLHRLSQEASAELRQHCLG